MAIDPARATTRRGLLMGALAGVVGGAAAALTQAGKAFGAGNFGQTVTVGGFYQDTASQTTFQNLSTDDTVLKLNSNAATKPTLDVGANVDNGIEAFSQYKNAISAIAASNAGYAVFGQAPYVAIKGLSYATGTTNGSGVGLFGTSASDDGAGVDGRSPHVGVRGVSAGIGIYGQGTGGGNGVRGTASSGGNGVYGVSTGGGIGVLGNSDTYRAVVGIVSASTGPTVGVFGESFSSAGTGVRGWAAGNGTGVYGFSGGSFPSGSPPANVGVVGGAPSGRGGQFSGGAAQLRLVPAGGAHPTNGLAGDLFLDSAKRLWLCQGGSTWKQIA